MSSMHTNKAHEGSPKLAQDHDSVVSYQEVCLPALLAMDNQVHWL